MKRRAGFFHWFFGVPVVLFQLYYIILHFTEFFRTTVLNLISGYPFGSEDMPWFFANQYYYGFYNLALGIIYTVLFVISLRFLIKQRSFDMMMSAVATFIIFMIFLYLNFPGTAYVE